MIQYDIYICLRIICICTVYHIQLHPQLIPIGVGFEPTFCWLPSSKVTWIWRSTIKWWSLLERSSWYPKLKMETPISWSLQDDFTTWLNYGNYGFLHTSINIDRDNPTKFRDDFLAKRFDLPYFGVLIWCNIYFYCFFGIPQWTFIPRILLNIPQWYDIFS